MYAILKVKLYNVHTCSLRSSTYIHAFELLKALQNYRSYLAKKKVDEKRVATNDDVDNDAGFR